VIIYLISGIPGLGHGQAMHLLLESGEKPPGHLPKVVAARIGTSL